MFKDFSRFNVEGKTAWLDVPELGSKARIQFRPATEANVHYFNASQQLATARSRGKMLSNEAMNAEDYERSREDDRTLFPKFVISGWENVEGSDDDFVPFSRANAAVLCRDIPGHIFDGWRVFAKMPQSFYDLPDPKADDVDELAGN